MNKLVIEIAEALVVPLESVDVESMDSGAVPLLVSGALLPPIVELEVRDGVPYCGLRRAPDTMFQHPPRVPGPSRIRARADVAPGSPAARELYAELVRIIDGRGPLLPFVVRVPEAPGTRPAQAFRGNGFISAARQDALSGVEFELVVTAFTSDD